jgi:hypothetical protein
MFQGLSAPVEVSTGCQPEIKKAPASRAVEESSDSPIASIKASRVRAPNSLGAVLNR